MSSSTISPEILKETALRCWTTGKPIPISYWPHYVQGGLYDWAASNQRDLLAAKGVTAEIPSKQALILHLAPAPEPLVLVPSPQPPEQPTAPLSKRRLNRGRRTVEAVQARINREQSLAFSPHDFVMFALPHKRLDATTYERINGRFRVTLTTTHGYTIPFGQDRLFPIWLATAFQAAGQPADNLIRFRSASDILKAFKQSPDGEYRAVLRERIMRWHHTIIDVDRCTDARDHVLRYGLIEEASLWYDRKGGTNQYTLWQNTIKLNSRFAAELRKNAIPIDFETVVSLRESPGALDLYIWQAHRSWELAKANANRPVAVPLAGLLAQLGTQSPPRKAKQLLKAWQGTVKEIWRGCPNYFDAERNLFFLHPAQAVFDRATTKLPGVLPVPPVPLRPADILDGAADADLLVLKRQPPV
jgi:hypothetical protein